MQDDERYEEEAQYDEETGGDEEAVEETQEEDSGDGEAEHDGGGEEDPTDDDASEYGEASEESEGDGGDSDDGAEHDGGGEEDPTDDDASEYGEESDESEGGGDDSDDAAEHDGGGDEDPTDDDASDESNAADADGSPGPSDRSRRSNGRPASTGHARSDDRSGPTRAAPGSSSAASSSAAPPPPARPGVDQLYADVAQRRRLARFAFSSDTHDSVLFMWAALAYHQRPTQDRGQFILDWFLQPTRRVWSLNVSRAVEAELPRVSAHAHSADANAFTPFVGAARNDIQLDVLDRFFIDKKPPQDPAHGRYAREYKQFVAAARKAGFTLHELGLD